MVQIIHERKPTSMIKRNHNISLKPIIEQLSTMTTPELEAEIKAREARIEKRKAAGQPPATEADGYARLMLMHNHLNERLWQEAHAKRWPTHHESTTIGKDASEAQMIVGMGTGSTQS